VDQDVTSRQIDGSGKSNELLNVGVAWATGFAREFILEHEAQAA
jgi:hypothetical protein